MNPPVVVGSSHETDTSSVIALREFHAFEAFDARFLYMVPSAGIFRMDDAGVAILDALQAGPRTTDSIVEELSGRFAIDRILETLDELAEIRAVGDLGAPKEQVPNDLPPADFPLNTMVLNVTNKCNLACTYCYEYGEDKIVDTKYGKQPKFMSEDTAEESVEFLLRESKHQEVAHLTFFGGETLLNFPVLKKTLAYARRRAAEEGKRIEFSLTTNGTLLQPDIIEWLAENQVGVTISIDGPKEVQDGLRVFHNGKGTYDVVLPKIKELLKVHRTRPIGARVTLTQKNMDVLRIFRHLTEEVGFWEVGLAPVTSQDERDYSITPEGKDHMLRQFEELAAEWLDCALRDEHHGFSNGQGHRGGDPQGREQGLWLRGWSRTDGRRDRRGRRALPSLRGLTGTHDRLGERGRGPREAEQVPGRPPHRLEDRLSHLLGAADLLGRLLPRGARSLRRIVAPEPALLHLGAELDPHVPGDLRSSGRSEPEISRTLRRLIERISH